MNQEQAEDVTQRILTLVRTMLRHERDPANATPLAPFVEQVVDALTTPAHDRSDQPLETDMHAANTEARIQAELYHEDSSVRQGYQIGFGMGMRYEASRPGPAQNTMWAILDTMRVQLMEIQSKLDTPRNTPTDLQVWVCEGCSGAPCRLPWGRTIIPIRCVITGEPAEWKETRGGEQ